MLDISLTDAMQDYAERQVAAGVHPDISEVVRAGMRRLMEDDGGAAFYRLRRDLAERMAEGFEDVDLRALLPDRSSP